MARCAAETDGLTIRRGVVVTKLIASRPDGAPDAVPHITGVETEGGEVITADIVIDAAGRNSSLHRLLRDAGAAELVEESDDSGFVYYARAFRSDDGSIPPALGGGLQAYGSVSTLTLAADNGTWQVAFVASGADAAMRKVRDEDVFEKVWRSYPLVAHWLDGEPISDLEVMAKLEDRIRHFVVDGHPVATGIAAVGDSWACTNPSVGRGASIGLLHGLAMRDHLRTASLDDPVAWALEWDRRTSESVEPYFHETVNADRHRLGQIEAAIEGRTYHSDDPTFAFTDALPVAAMRDPDALRAWLDSFMLLRTLADVMADETMVDRVLTLGSEAEPAPGLSRPELEALLVGQR